MIFISLERPEQVTSVLETYMWQMLQSISLHSRAAGDVVWERRPLHLLPEIVLVDARSLVRQKLLEQRVVPVLRLPSAELTERAVECLAEAGFRVFEITMTTPGAVALIEKLSQFTVGAGTLLDLETAERCVDAGAQFVVSPVVVPGLAQVARKAGCAALIGGFSPAEILAAHREGADIVKVFPASSGGPEHLRALRAVFPDVLLCPTGGVSLQNLRAYFDAGAALVGVGNSIIDLPALQAGDRARAVAHARAFLA